MGTVVRNVSKARGALAENIRREAERQSIGINRLADFAGVSRSQLFDVLGSKKGASVDWIDKIADVFGIPAHELLRRHAKRKSN